MPRPYRFQVVERLLIGWLVIEALLFASAHFGWFGLDDKQGWPLLVATGMLGLALLLLLLWLADSLLFRRRFQFSLKAVLLLVLTVAVPCSWLVVQRSNVARERTAARALADAGMIVLYRDNADRMTSEPAHPSGLRDYLRGKIFADAERVGPASLALDPFSASTDPRVQDFSDDDVALLIEGAPNAKRLDLSGTQVTDAGLAHLNRFKHLEDLILDRTQITDAGMAHLEGLTTLQSLHLNQTGVTDAGLSHLRSLTKLRSLLLEDTRVDGSGLRHLEHLKSLEWLVLTNTQLDDAALEHVGRHSSLCSLGLQATRVTDAGVEHLKGLGKLMVMMLRDTEVTDTGIRDLAGLTKLEFLDLGGTLVTGAGTEHLKGLTSLRVLFLPTGVATGAEMKHLQRILPNCSISIDDPEQP